MHDFVLSTRARDMLLERNIPEEWLWRTLNTPDKKRRGDDCNLHYSKAIKECNGRVLYVIVNNEDRYETKS